jgi:nitrate reductase NapD
VRLEGKSSMTISGIVVACRPEHLVATTQAIERIPWADLHYTDPKGRLVVTIEAADIDESMDRLQELQALPRVLMAELAEYCVEQEEAESSPHDDQQAAPRRQAMPAALRTRRPHPGGNHEPDPT